MTSNSESKAFINKLVSQIPLGIIAFDVEGKILMVNSRAKNLLNIEMPLKQLSNQNILNVITTPKILGKIKNSLTNDRINFTLRRLEICDRFLTVKGQKLMEGMVLIILDQTESVRAQDLATQNLILGQESERSRLAKEIHDGIGPMMSTIRLQLDSVASISSEINVITKLETIKKILIDTSQDLRQISHDLMPSSLKDFGLVPAILTFVERVNNGHKINVIFDHNCENLDIKLEYELNLFRMIQELINNAVKYAECSEIQIQLRKFKKNLQLTVEDNGVGINIDEINKGIGLQNINTRVKSLHGYFNLDSQPGNGFNAQVIIPLKEIT